MKIITISLLFAILSGCAALEQAPLVYSSKQVVGFDVSIGSPESNISFGYTSIDAAYVPVAVSKEGMSDIEKISGTSSDGNSSNNITNDMKNEEEQAKDKISDIKNKILATKTLVTSLEMEIENQQNILRDHDEETAELKRSIQLLDSSIKIAGLEKGEITSQSNNPDDQNKSSELDLKINKLGGEIALEKEELKSKEDARALKSAIVEGQVKASRKDIDQNKIELSRLDNELKDALSEQANLVNEIKLNTEETKIDAYSVYGKFNTNGSFLDDDKAKSSIDIGKVFSTGVASQNISQGIQSRAVYKSISDCLDSLTKFIKEMPQELLTDKTLEKLEICKYKGNESFN